ncbi:hypothetical protein [Salinicola avicenniae]|uniref:hypothetical protein n=1 Tax=Salinicola avicenniae TaxID=2916836 RepID=UPI00207395AE|nr:MULTISPECIES: hypothetical protein [unclassified Salinicola]
MADIEQLKERIRDAVQASQQQRLDFERGLEARRQQLIEVQTAVVGWLEALNLDSIETQTVESTHSLSCYGEEFHRTLPELVVSLGTCKLYLRPEEQYLSGHRMLLFASSAEEDAKEIIRSEEGYHYSDLQFGQKRHLSQYAPFTAEAFYKLLYAWLRV